MTLSIARGSVIGLYGETGSGKSTIIDLIMGFLSPSRGQISLDEEPLAGEVLRGWQSNLSLVPQTIYLADTTIIRNVAFGVDPNHIDLLKVRKCIAAAQLNSFIEGLPDGLDTFVGERGVQMSGGQRQRLGIARALYRDPKVLILDEATSALDPETESAIVKNIDSVSRGMTMIIIAHRFQTLIGCDVILKIANGKIERRGTYQDIFGESL
jgi:ATP-binding cassette subfamily B protein